MTRIILSLLAMTLALARGELPALDLPADLTTQRREFVDRALKELEAHPGLPYRYAGSCPEDGGMDCSGSVFYVLNLLGIDPPRSAAEQFTWVKDSGKLVTVPLTVTKPEDPAFAAMLPGDLLFWATLDPDGTQRVSHVEIYLGKETKDGRRVMIGASDGRSYRGAKKDGYDIVDFQVPKTESNKKLVGYGPPVWDDQKKDSARKEVAKGDSATKEPDKKEPPKKDPVKKKPTKKETPKKPSRKRDAPDPG